MTLLRTLVCVVIAVYSSASFSANNGGGYSGVMGTQQIISATSNAALTCMKWRPVGICVWMTCYGPICNFNTSVKVKNFVPELTVQAYDKGDGEPWTESQSVNKFSQGDADSSWVTTLISWVEKFDVKTVGIRGGVSTEAKKDQHANLYFKLLDAYGNPGIQAFNKIANSTGGYVCKGVATMFWPYLISNLDSVAWRWDIPEMFYPQSLNVFTTAYDLGDSLNNYGPIYPRHGFMTAQDPLKGAVLAAFRAVHVITRKNEPHLYWSIYEDPSPGYWPPKPLDKNVPDTGQWQQLYPYTDSQCRSFPYDGNPPAYRRSQDGNYIWNFWRSYKCCEREGQVLVWHYG